MTRDELLKLADRVEALTGPDRDVDRAIELAFMPDRLEPCPTVPLLSYTASLDAALTLVPEGWRSYSADMSIEDRTRWTMLGPKTKWVEGSDGQEAGDDWYQNGVARTPALAATAAAIRAHATTLGD